MSLKNSNEMINLNSTIICVYIHVYMYIFIYIYIKDFLYSCSWILRSRASQPDTCGRPGQANNLVPLQTDIV